VNADGTCPQCGASVDAGGATVATDDAAIAMPWHLKLLLGALAVYLGYRAWEGLAWVWDRIG